MNSLADRRFGFSAFRFLPALVLCLSAYVQAAPVEFVGDSYMAGMSPFFKAWWPVGDSKFKVGSGLAYWQKNYSADGVSYAFISLGINDLPANPSSQWADDYSLRVGRFLQKFSPDAVIFWFLPPCSVRGDGVERVNLLRFAIARGVASSSRKARFVSPSPDVCSHMVGDRIHFTRSGYQLFAASVFKN